MLSNDRKRILLVEDNPHDAALTISALKASDLPLDVDAVGDGEDALDYLFRRGAYKERIDLNPNLILLDLKMPKLGGVETLQQIKSDERLRLLPVVMLTSSREPQDLRTCYQLGVNGYVVKPVDAKHFMSALRALAHYWLSANESLLP